MSLRRKYVLILVGFCLLLTVAGGVTAWVITRGALERELDQRLVWVAGAAAAVDARAPCSAQRLRGRGRGGLRRRAPQQHRSRPRPMLSVPGGGPALT